MSRLDFEIDALQIDPTDPTLMQTRGRGRGGDHKAQRYFVKVPLAWLQKLEGLRAKRIAWRYTFCSCISAGAARRSSWRIVRSNVKASLGSPSGARYET
jgi:hypothetical protein